MKRTSTSRWSAVLAAAAVLCGASLLAVPSAAAQAAPTDAQNVTWNCTSSPCPWGNTTSGHTAIWNQPALSERLGYTTTQPVYLAADRANGMTITIQSGTAGIYAGTPQASSHSRLSTLNPGQSYTVTGLTTDAVISIQSGATFTYTTTTGPTTTTLPTTTLPPTTIAPTTTTTTLPATTLPATTLPATTLPPTTVAPTTTTTTLPATTLPATTLPATTLPATTLPPTTTTVPVGTNTGASITWNCTSSPCPWGSTTSGHAAIWSQPALSERLGYTTTQPVYLPADRANGMTITIQSGTAGIYAGTPQASSHSRLSALNPGQSYTVTGLTTDAVISIQSGATFTYTTTTGTTTTLPATTLPGATTTLPGATTTVPATTLPATTTTTTTTIVTGPPCTNPTSCTVVDAVAARWRCNTPGCSSADWVGAAINWPAWSAYSTNGRQGFYSRTVYSTEGQLVTPYMGAWANGCAVTAVSTGVLIIEWERGTNVFREIPVAPGQTHVISITSPENGAMIETYEGLGSFKVSLANCTPAPVPNAG